MGFRAEGAKLPPKEVEASVERDCLGFRVFCVKKSEYAEESIYNAFFFIYGFYRGLWHSVLIELVEIG